MAVTVTIETRILALAHELRERAAKIRFYSRLNNGDEDAVGEAYEDLAPRLEAIAAGVQDPIDDGTLLLHKIWTGELRYKHTSDEHRRKIDQYRTEMGLIPAAGLERDDPADE